MKIERHTYGSEKDGWNSGVSARNSGAGVRDSGRNCFTPEGAYRAESSGSRRAHSGSRYADKADRRSGNRKKKRKSGRRLFPVLLLLLLAAIICGGAAIFLPVIKDSWNSRGTVLPDVDLSSLDSPYAVLLEADGGQEIGAKQADEKIFPASMTKIMTVWTAIETIGEKNLDQTVTMSYDYYDELYAQDASRAGFEPGEEAVIRDLLYGALLPSGAECCMQLALEAAGSEEVFVEKMNQNAQELGLEQTHFTNCTGLHNEEEYSTAREIALILRAALKNETFRTVFTTHFYTVGATAQHPDGFTFWSTMFKNMETETVNGGEIMGGKTGYTSEAGHCLASMAEIGGNEYILVTAGWASVSEEAINTYHISDAFAAYNLLGTALGYGSQTEAS